jgi:hypothetical protein
VFSGAKEDTIRINSNNYILEVIYINRILKLVDNMSVLATNARTLIAD